MPPPRQTQHDVSWQHPLTRKRHVLRVTVTQDYVLAGNTHLELETVIGQPHPLSQTGYRSHFIDTDKLATAGGAVAFVAAWITSEMPQFLRLDLKARQGGLFEWAAAQGPANAPRKPSRPRPRARATPSRCRPPAGPSRG